MAVTLLEFADVELHPDTQRGCRIGVDRAGPDGGVDRRRRDQRGGGLAVHGPGQRLGELVTATAHADRDNGDVLRRRVGTAPWRVVEPAGERRQHRAGDVRMGPSRALELVPSEAIHDGVSDGDHRSVPAIPGEQGQLADGLASSHFTDQRVAARVGDDEAQPTTHDHVQAVAGVALREERRSGGQVDPLERSRQCRPVGAVVGGGPACEPGGEIAPADGIEHERTRVQRVAEAFEQQHTKGMAGSALGRHEVAPSVDGELEHPSVDRRRRDVGRLGVRRAMDEDRDGPLQFGVEHRRLRGDRRQGLGRIAVDRHRGDAIRRQCLPPGAVTTPGTRGGRGRACAGRGRGSSRTRRLRA